MTSPRRKRRQGAVTLSLFFTVVVTLWLEGVRIDDPLFKSTPVVSSGTRTSKKTTSILPSETKSPRHTTDRTDATFQNQKETPAIVKGEPRPWPPPLDERATIRPPPVKQTTKLASVPLYQLWNHNTQRLDLPNKRPESYNGPLSSLEILQEILEGVHFHSKADGADSCFVPRNNEARGLANRISGGQERLSYPILNVGACKSGSTSLHSFFQCAGIRSSHVQNGKKMKDLVDAGGPQPLGDSQIGPPSQAYLQLDYNFDECVYPQIQFLDELHREFPHATMILNFRPILDWIRSAERWFDMAERWRACKLPGLVCNGEMDEEGRHVCTHNNLAQWWCGHVRHIREFVRQYPTHKLIEIDLYDHAETAETLSRLFSTNETCWGHVNKYEDVYRPGDGS